MLLPETVHKIAGLTKLTLSEDEARLFADQLGEVLQYMNKLNELDTNDIEPLYSPVKQTSVLREDTIFQEYDKQDLLKNAPKTDGDYFIVPKIL